MASFLLSTHTNELLRSLGWQPDQQFDTTRFLQTLRDRGYQPNMTTQSFLTKFGGTKFKSGYHVAFGLLPGRMLSKGLPQVPRSELVSPLLLDAVGRKMCFIGSTSQNLIFFSEPEIFVSVHQDWDVYGQVCSVDDMFQWSLSREQCKVEWFGFEALESKHSQALDELGSMYMHGF